jgi:hypothetical protein
MYKQQCSSGLRVQELYYIASVDYSTILWQINKFLIAIFFSVTPRPNFFSIIQNEITENNIKVTIKLQRHLLIGSFLSG